ncbi:interleukin-10 receptor subunit beta [Kryptolebias marmoratus]|uniref:Interleukin-10 receptor subunit beta-like n=1 Tax=Kryptolebias marmoratus TaxID=37003 RepID=A0A3Q3A0A5_KRYMA|nr:interleukin-10 receptor subunit beta [Kryptolebias marmoratus]
MSATLCALILTVSALIRAVSGVLGGPTNVTLSSNNLNLVLRWKPPNGAPRGVIYTTEFKSTVASEYRKGCVNISAPECDLTSFNITEYGNYTGRVQVLLGAESSLWVESNHITPDKDTVIGPPEVSVLSNGQTLEVSMTDPKFSHSSLRNVFISASYNITYWKKGQKDKSKQIAVTQTRVILNDLEPNSEYCVQVHIQTSQKPNQSILSRIICESTTDEQSLWVETGIVLVIMVVALVLVVLVMRNWRNISQFLFPKEALPQHFKDPHALLAKPRSSVYLVSSKPVEEFNQVRVVAAEEGRLLEEAGSVCSRQPEGGEGDGDVEKLKEEQTAELLPVDLISS